MKRLSVLLWCVAVSVCGCQTLAKPTSETQVDRELVTHPAPRLPDQGPTQQEPRPGFEQEPPKSQSP